MPSNSEDTAQLSSTTCLVSDARGDSQASTDTSNIASPSPPHPSSVSATNYGTFDSQLRNHDHQHLFSCLESSLEACFEICFNGDDNDSSSSSSSSSSSPSSYFLSAQQSEGSSTSYPPSLSSEDSFVETGSFRFEDQSSDSEATLEGTRPGKDLGYRSHERMQYPGNGGS